MMKVIIISCLLCLANLAFPQAITRKITDQQTGAAIPYATVKILHQPRGEIASDKGEFVLTIDPADSVLISSVGYQPGIFTGKNIGVIIYLQPKIKTMTEVMVQKEKLLRTVILGNGVAFLKRKIRCRMGKNDLGNDLECWPWGPTNDGKDEFAQKIELPDSSFSYKLKKVIIPLRKECAGPMLLHIYETDSVTGLPSEEIFLKAIDLNGSNIRKQKAYIDVSAENLIFRKTKSFCIGLGWPPGAAEEECFTTILLMKSEKANTFSRSLYNKNYDWIKFWNLRNENNELLNRNTIYCVELDEMK